MITCIFCSQTAIKKPKEHLITMIAVIIGEIKTNERKSTPHFFDHMTEIECIHQIQILFKLESYQLFSSPHHKYLKCAFNCDGL